MSQHTPGPWRVGIDKHSVWASKAKEPCVAACKEGSREANARLIAQAPAMLDALRLLVADANERDDEPSGLVQARAILDALEAAKRNDKGVKETIGGL